MYFAKSNCLAVGRFNGRIIGIGEGSCHKGVCQGRFSDSVGRLKKYWEKCEHTCTREHTVGVASSEDMSHERHSLTIGSPGLLLFDVRVKALFPCSFSRTRVLVQ